MIIKSIIKKWIALFQYRSNFSIGIYVILFVGTGLSWQNLVTSSFPSLDSFSESYQPNVHKVTTPKIIFFGTVQNKLYIEITLCHSKKATLKLETSAAMESCKYLLASLSLLLFTDREINDYVYLFMLKHASLSQS